MILLLARLPDGQRAPAVRSIFPGHETDLQASTFPTLELAELGASMAAQLGSTAPVFEMVDRDGVVRARAYRGRVGA